MTIFKRWVHFNPSLQKDAMQHHVKLASKCVENVELCHFSGLNLDFEVIFDISKKLKSNDFIGIAI